LGKECFKKKRERKSGGFLKNSIFRFPSLFRKFFFEFTNSRLIVTKKQKPNQYVYSKKGYIQKGILEEFQLIFF